MWGGIKSQQRLPGSAKSVPLLGLEAVFIAVSVDFLQCCPETWQHSWRVSISQRGKEGLMWLIQQFWHCVTKQKVIALIFSLGLFSRTCLCIETLFYIFYFVILQFLLRISAEWGYKHNSVIVRETWNMVKAMWHNYMCRNKKTKKTVIIWML